MWTNPRAGATTSDADEAGQHIYRWKHSDLHPTVGADAEAAKKAEDRRLLTPDEELDATEGKLPSFAWTTFPDWAAVGAWYRALVADRIAPDAAIKAKVDELTSGKSTDLEKAQAIYNFVSARMPDGGYAGSHGLEADVEGHDCPSCSGVHDSHWHRPDYADVPDQFEYLPGLA